MSRKKNQQKTSLLYSRPAAVLLLVVLAVLVLNLLDILEKYRGTRRQHRIAGEEYARLDARRAGLEAELSDLRTAEGREGLIRERYPVAKEGEGVVVIVDQPAPAVPAPEKPGFLDRIKRMFGKRE